MSDLASISIPTGDAQALDEARQDALRALAAAAAAGGLTLDEYAEQVAAAARSTDVDELVARAAAARTATSDPSPAAHRSVLVGIFGGSSQRGRWRLARRLWIVAVLGGATLDLGQAEVERSESTITALTLLGGVDITAPAGIPIVLSGVSLLSGKSDERPRGAHLPEAPLIRVRAISLLGGVKVKSREPGAPLDAGR